MARIRNGILGGFSGKVGDVIGQNYSGVSVIRAMPKNVYQPNTQAQVDHRNTFKQLALLMKGANMVLRYCNESKNRVYNGFNEAMRFNWREAVIDNQIDLESLTFGTFWGAPFQGMKIEPIWNVNILNLSLAWDTTTNDWNMFADDQLMVILIHTMVDKPSYVCGGGFLRETRSQGDAEISVIFDNPFVTDERLDIYLGVNSPNTYYGYTKQVPSKTIKIPAKNVVGFSAAESLRRAQWGDYYYNRPHWFTNIVG